MKTSTSGADVTQGPDAATLPGAMACAPTPAPDVLAAVFLGERGRAVLQVRHWHVTFDDAGEIAASGSVVESFILPLQPTAAACDDALAWRRSHSHVNDAAVVLHAEGRPVTIVAMPAGTLDAVLEEIRRHVGGDTGAEAGTGDGAPTRASAPPATAVLPFPLDVLPAALARFVREGAASMQCPADFFGVNMLVIAGALAGARVRIHVSDDWQERACLWAAIVADPSAVKSPVMKRVLRIVRALDADDYRLWQEGMKVWRREIAALRRARQQYERELPLYRRELAAWEAQSADKRGPQPQAPIPPPDEDPPRPILHRALIDDTTVEELATMLAENPTGLLYAGDELSAWTRSLGQYKGGRGRDREVWLQIWDGSPLTIDRKGSHEAGPQHIPDPFVGVVGNLVPDNLDVFLAQGSRSDGFLYRVLTSFPNTVLPGAWTGATISLDAEAAWQEAVVKLHSLRLQSLLQSIELPLTPAAAVVWADFFAAHNAEVSAGAVPYSLSGLWGKLRGYCARLALVVHLMRWACCEASLDAVDDVSLRAAVTLVTYFKSHARRVYARLPATPDDKRAERVLAWIRKRGGAVTVRQVVRSQVGGIKTADDAKAVFEELQDRELGMVQKLDHDSVQFTLAR